MSVSGMIAVMDTEEAIELMEVSLGHKEADLVIINARLANVYTGEILNNYAVAVKGKLIAFLGENAQGNIGTNTFVIDAEGMTIIPGLIDGHSHLAPMFDACEFTRYALPGGTTAIIAETMEPFPMCGYEGILDFLKSFSGQPLKVFATVPSMVSISRTCRGIPTETVKRLLERDDILGLGESYWQAVLQEPDRYLPSYQETLHCGKKVEGHSAGASGRKLMAYAALGVSSCHEPISAEEVLERLRLGFHVMVREGSIRRELAAVSRIKDMNVDLRRLTLATDGIDPRDLLEKGYMEYVVQKAIDCGFEPMTAIRMATINIAEHFSLDGIMGGIAPGKYADMVIIPDLKTIRPEYVISNGKIVAQNGKMLVEPRKPLYSEASRNSIHLPSLLKAEDFAIHVTSNNADLQVRIINQATDLVTTELKLNMPVINGELRTDIEKDIIKVAAVDRTYCPGKLFIGLLHGFHMQSGAFASSATWDSSDIVVVGVNDDDMALAVNSIHDMQGGTVVCDGGKIIAEFPLPVFGLISDLPMKILKKKMEEIEDAAALLGLPFANPFLTLITLTGAAIPYLRICEEGLVNLKDGKILGLTVLE